MKIYLTVDERYPDYGWSTDSKYKKFGWDEVDIPEDKFEWIEKVAEEYRKMQDYLEDLEEKARAKIRLQATENGYKDR